MNKLICLVLVLLVATQCTKEEVKPAHADYTVPMSFDVNGKTQLVSVNFKFDYSKNRFVSTNSNILETTAINKETKGVSFVYFLIGDSNNSGRIMMAPVQPSYWYNSDSGCYIWGTMYVGDNGDYLFVPGNQATNPPLCGYYYA